MTMPNFLIIGAARAGTTSLYYCLKQHPQVYMCSVKEPNFFALENEKPYFRGPGDERVINNYSISSLDAYRAQFQEVTDEAAIGEASTLYLYSPKAPERIRYYIPDAKLIAILRNSTERAYSNFMYAIRDGREPLTDFAQALSEEETRIRNNWGPLWHYKRRGYYYTQLKRYFDIFDRSQIRIYLYDDFKTDFASVLQDVFEFLEVDEIFIPDRDVRHNISGIPKNKILHTFLIGRNPVRTLLSPLLPVSLRGYLKNLRSQNLLRPPLPPDVRKQLIGEYREDILKLQDLIQRDLSAWLE